MCARTTCRSCGKATVSGCGQHVELALRGVPKADRCQGHQPTTSASGARSQKGSSLLSRLFGGE